MAQIKKCRSCGKELTDAEQITFLINEVARLERELTEAKRIPPINIPPFQSWPKPWYQPGTTWTCNTSCMNCGMYRDDKNNCKGCGKNWSRRDITSGTQYCYPSQRTYDLMQPTGDMCSNTCRMNGLDKNGGCLQCGRMQPPMGTGLL